MPYTIFCVYIYTHTHTHTHSTATNLFQEAKMYKILHTSQKTNTDYISCAVLLTPVCCIEKLEFITALTSWYSKIRSFHYGGCDNCFLWGCNAVQTGWGSLTFLRFLLPPLSVYVINNPLTLAMKAMGSFKTPVPFYQIITHNRRQ